MKLLELEVSAEPRRDVELPAFDVLGVPHGRHYSPILEMGDVRGATRAGFTCPKHGREIQCLSPNEKRIFMKVLTHPYVLDAREQYPQRNEVFECSGLER